MKEKEYAVKYPTIHKGQKNTLALAKRAAKQHHVPDSVRKATVAKLDVEFRSSSMSGDPVSQGQIDRIIQAAMENAKREQINEKYIWFMSKLWCINLINIKKKDT